MKKAPALLVTLLCLTTMACKPHDHNDRGDRGFRQEQRMERRGGEGERRGGLRKFCRTDMEQFCASAQTGRDRRQCLIAHMDKLSADCKTALQERMNRRGGRNRDFNQNNGTNQNDDN